MNLFDIANLILGVLFIVCYAYQIFYVIYTLFKKPKTFAPTDQTNRYAVLICGRNEEAVIGYLLDSLKAQDYPADRFDVYVCADNCTDRTAEVVREHGAIAYERFNTTKIGKGYALSELIQFIFKTHGQDHYDGYFIIDADNLLDPHFITEMDKAFCAPEGYKVVNGYRNSKNFGDNWLSASYAVWFLHDAKQLNNARCLLGTNAAVAGTGFVIHKDVLKSQGGWIHHGLIEDIEFTADAFTRDVKFGYCHDAILYDEQPTSFVQSWHQRMRWVKGYLQVLKKYGWALTKRMCRKGGFACFDLMCNISAAYLLTTTAFLLNLVYLIVTLIINPAAFLGTLITSLVMLFGGYMCMLFLSFFVCITEKERIHASTGKRILGMLTFPLFMMSFVPIAIIAIFTPRVSWKPIKHTAAMSVKDVKTKDK